MMTERAEPTRILVPVDGDEGALRAVRLAGEMARIMDAAVDFLYVTPFDESTDTGDVAWLPDSIAGSTAAEAQEIFKSAAAALPHGISYTVYHRAGVPADEILRFIQERESDLVVMGGRKVSRVRGLLLGSVTQRILEHAQTRVLVTGRDSS